MFQLLYILGVGSNVLVRDSGIRGEVRLGRDSTISKELKGIVVGASTLEEIGVLPLLAV